MADYTIDVTYQNGILTFSGNCDSAGNVNVNWGPTDVSTITFRLFGETGDQWAGIRIARDPNDVMKAPAVLDTEGNFYGATCFKVGPTTQSPAPPEMPLGDFDNSAAPGAWFYCVGIQHSDGSQSWPDPKIENPGGDSQELPPGIYFGGMATMTRN